MGRKLTDEQVEKLIEVAATLKSALKTNDKIIQGIRISMEAVNGTDEQNEFVYQVLDMTLETNRILLESLEN